MTNDRPSTTQHDAATVGLARGVDRRATVTAALEAIASEMDLRKVRRVLVKPNFVLTDCQFSATHVDAIRAVLDFVRQRYDGPIVVAEGAALTPTWEGFRNYGYQSLTDEYGVQLQDLNGDKVVEIVVYNRRLQPMRLRLARTVVEADFRISVCPPKTHDLVIVTLSIKNMAMGAPVNPNLADGTSKGSQGIVRNLGRMAPGWLRRSALAEIAKSMLAIANGAQKPAMHQGIPVLNLNLALLASATWPHLAVIDGWEGMEGEGPSRGDLVPWRVALAGTDPLAVDTLTTHLMGFDPAQVGYLQYCRWLGLGVGTVDKIEVVGNIPLDQARRPFAPHPTYRRQLAWRMDSAERYLQPKQGGIGEQERS
jgi:uncharacterized protein (DUF362 family)